MRTPKFGLSRTTLRSSRSPRAGFASRSRQHAARLGLLLLAALAWSVRAKAADSDDVVLLPTVLFLREAPGAPPVLRPPEPRDGRELQRWARRLDSSLREAVQDLGLTLDVSQTPSATPSELSEDALIERAQKSWVVSPRLEPQDGALRLRILAVAPGSRVLLLRVQEVEPREIELRSMVMMRDVVQAGRGAPARERAVPALPDEHAVAERARSAGRAVLALNSAALGGYIGFSIQRASGSDDPRLTYPLIALGTGIGLGGSMIVADEWDVGLGDAWYLSAGMIWPTAAGLLLAHSYDVQPEDERHLYGLLGAAVGLSLATAALTFEGMGEGGATLAHSGGAFGLLLGGVAQLAYEGSTDITPTRGMGYGTGIGVLAAGALATQIRTSPSRVLLVDLGASLGALTGAAAASPLLFVEEGESEGRSRAWLSSIAAGTVAGGVLAYWLTKPEERPPTASSKLNQRAGLSELMPFAGVIGEKRGSSGRPSPLFGLGVRGSF